MPAVKNFSHLEACTKLSSRTHKAHTSTITLRDLDKWGLFQIPWVSVTSEAVTVLAISFVTLYKHLLPREPFSLWGVFPASGSGSDSQKWYSSPRRAFSTSSPAQLSKKKQQRVEIDHLSCRRTRYSTSKLNGVVPGGLGGCV